MAIQRIDADSVYKNSVERLANRPTAASRVGQGGLTPDKLKAVYDALAKLAIGKVNEVVEAINAAPSAESIAGLMMTPIPTGELDGEYKTLYEVLLDLIDGDLAGYLKLNGLWDDDLQGELEYIQREIGEKQDEASDQGSIYARIAFALVKIAANAQAIAAFDKHKWGTDNLQDGAITRDKLADGSASTEKIAAGAVTNEKISDGAVSSDKLALGAVMRDHIANSAVNSDKLAAESVGEAKLTADARLKLNSAFSSVSYNATTGVLTFTASDGTQKSIDLPLELLIRDGYYAYEYSTAVLIPGPTYTVGKYCVYNGGLYRCINNTSGEFDPAAWELVAENAESDSELVLELASGSVIEIPAAAMASSIMVDTTLTESGQAADAAVVGTELARVVRRLNELEYVPVKINSFSSNYGDVEIGKTIGDIVLNWTLNKEGITSQDIEIHDANGLVTGVGGILPSTRRYEFGGTIDSYRKYILIVGDGKNTATASTSINFLNGVYYGAAAVPSAYNSAFMLGLTKKLASSRVGTVNVTAGEGKYIYYAYPSRMGAASFVVGGFSGGFELVDTISFTNASGYTENYYIYKSEQVGLGALKVEVS